MRAIAAGLILGFALGVLFWMLRRSVKGPDSSRIKKQTFTDPQTKETYRLVPVVCVRPPLSRVDELEHSDGEESFEDIEAIVGRTDEGASKVNQQ